MPNDYDVYEPDRAEAEEFPIDVDDPEQIDLGANTNLENMNARLWYFEPGEKVSFHYHDVQEELYYVVSGTGQVLVGEDAERVEVPEGGMIRPAPGTPRQLRNDTDETTVWLIVGAPPEVEAQLWDSYDDEGYPADDGVFTDLGEWF